MLRSCWLPLLVLWGFFIESALPSQAATVQVASHIAFAEAGGASTQNDINFGHVNVPRHAVIRINSVGQTYLDARGPVRASDSQAGSIEFDSPIDQLMNLLSTNYRASHNVLPIKATCSVNGSHDGDCNRLYDVISKSRNTLRIGMQVMVAGNMQVLGPTSHSSFDLCVVYQ